MTGSAKAETLFAYGVGAAAAQPLLVSFDSARPETLLTNVAITGLQADDGLLDIDFRPANGLLYGLSLTSGATVGRLYTINTTTGVATLASTLSGVALNNDLAAIDFNPVADRLRILNGRENLRADVGTGTVIRDTPLGYAPDDPNASSNFLVTGAAYTDNFAGATTTTLYDLENVQNGLVRQDPPNAGVLRTVGSLNTGPFSNLVGFDISGATGTAYAALDLRDLSVSGSNLYTVNLTTGNATLAGNIASGQLLVRGLAAPVGRAATTAIPEPGSLVLAGAGLWSAMGFTRRRRRRRPA